MLFFVGSFSNEKSKLCKNLVKPSSIFDYQINGEVKAESAKKWFFFHDGIAAGVYFFHCDEHNQTVTTNLNHTVKKGKKLDNTKSFLHKVLNHENMKSIPQHIKSVIEKIYNFPKTRQQKDIISSESFSKEVSRRLLADSVSSNLLLQPLQPVFFEVFHVGNIKNFGPIFIVMEYYQQADGTFSDLKKIEFADGITFLFQLFKDQFTFMNKKKFYHSDIHQNNICYFDVDSHFFCFGKNICY